MKTIAALKTTPDFYLTGRTALNIASDEDTGDWNFYNYFLDGNNEYFVESVTNTPWGSNGIVEVSKWLKKQGFDTLNAKVYAADHYRAIADLFLDSKNTSKNYKHLLSAVDDWLNTLEQKLKLFSYLKLLNDPKINNWINEQQKS
jgi:hypothetical protein